MNSRFTQIILALFFLTPLITNAQKGVKNKKETNPTGYVSTAIQYLNIGNGNLSSLGLQYSDAFNKMVPSLQLFVGGGITENSVSGISYNYMYSHNRIGDAHLNSNLSMHSIGLYEVNNYKRKNMFGSIEFLTAYLHYRNRYIPWDSDIKRGTVTAHGFEVGVSLSGGYVTKSGWGFGLQCGIKAQQLYKWSGDERFIDHNSYNGGLFTSKCNSVVVPYAGIVVYLKSSKK